MNENAQYIKMTQTPVPLLVAGLTVPTVISMLVTNIYNMADTAFVGRINTQATAAVGASSLVITCVVGFFTGLSVGVSVVEETDLKARVAAGNYDVAFYPVKAPYFGLAGYYEQFSANAPRSLTYLNDPAFDADVEALRYAPDGGRSRISALAASLISHAVLLPVWQENSVFLLGEGVSGVRMLPGNERVYFFDAVSG